MFAANGSNEVLQTLLLTYAGAGRSVLTFEPTYQLHAHIARITGATVVEEERRADFTLDPGDVAEAVARHRPAVTFLCSPNNPTGIVEAPAVVDAALAAADGLVVVDEAYAQFAGWSALDLVADDRPLCVVRTFSKTWSMAAARLGYLVGPSWLVGHLDDVVLPYHLDTVKQLAGTLALGHVDEMDERVKIVVDERERLVEGLAGAARRHLSQRCQLRALPGGRGRRRDRAPRVAGPRRSQRAGARLLGLAPPRWLPAGDDRDAAGERPLPRRAPRGPDMTRSATCSRTTKETSIEIAIDLDGTGRTECSTGIPFYDHMLDQLGRHGGFDLTVKATGDLDIDTHHTVEDVAIALGEAFRDALGDKAGIRRFASGLYPLDEALVEVALDLSGRPFVAWDVPMPESLPLGNPAFDPQLAEHAVSSFATNAGITLHVTMKAGRNVHHIIEATFKGLARSLRDAVRVDGPGGVPSTKGVL